jgi:hypothetical protein
MTNAQRPPTTIAMGRNLPEGPYGKPEPKPDVGRQHGNDSGGQPEATGEPMNEECVALLMKTSSRNPKAPSLMVAAFQAPAKEPKRRLSVDY